MSDSDVDFLMPYAVGGKAKQKVREDTDMAARVKKQRKSLDPGKVSVNQQNLTYRSEHRVLSKVNS